VPLTVNPSPGGDLSPGDIMARPNRLAVTPAIIAVTWGCLEAPRAAEAPSCLTLREMNVVNATSETTIVYRMRNGTVWVNTLPRPCRGLGTYPYVEVVRGVNQVCANQMQIRIPMTGAVCTLGTFSLQASDGN
jgi:hypothetical protein